ncbi:FtsK domain-containing protein OS=Streptomyces tendae OX=1932 GN=F3L20_10760 PE=4 SV=1 [Streptomyces tendae]
MTSLEWAAAETERRLAAAGKAHQAGDPPPEDTRRPLWLLLDRPSVFTHLAAADGGTDPQSLLQAPLRHGRAANVTVVVAEQFDGIDALAAPVRQHTRARVVLGPATAGQLESVLGAPPHTTPVDQMPPGRGYARLGTGPVHRLQVPATPDPYDDATSEAHRQAVLDLLPPRTTPVDEEAPVGADSAPAEEGAGQVPVPEAVLLDKAATEKVAAAAMATDAVVPETAPPAGPEGRGSGGVLLLTTLGTVPARGQAGLTGNAVPGADRRRVRVICGRSRSSPRP